MATPRKARPDVSSQHWVGGTLYLYEVARANLYWTPDPEYSPVLRLLHGGEQVEFVPEVKFDHWIIVRLGHQVGWVNLHTVEIVENAAAEPEPLPDAPPAIDPTAFLESHESRTERQTTEMRTPEFDQRLQASLEAVHADYELNDDFEQQLNAELQDLEDIALPEPPKGDDVSLGGLKRLIRYVTGLKGALGGD